MGLLEPENWRASWIAAPFAGEPPSPAHNGFHSAFASRAETPKWVSVDLGESMPFDTVHLFPARPYDWQPDTPGFLFPARFRIEAANEADFSDARTLADLTESDVPNPGATPMTFVVDNLTARYVRLFVTKLARRADEGQFAFALSQMAVVHEGANVALNKRVTASDCAGGTWSETALTNGVTRPGRGGDGRRQAAAMLRGEFEVNGPVRRATLYASALGVYEARINGARVGDHILAPEWTDYHVRTQYQTYDVTALVQEGRNALAAWLGDGWYAGRIGLSNIVPGGPKWGIYGANPKFIAQLEVESADGTLQTFGTGDTWRCSRAGLVRENDILDGETHDARRDLPGWDLPSFDDGEWLAVETPEVATLLVPQPNEPIRVVEELAPVALTEPAPGVHVYDLGQNMVGWVRFTAEAPRGTTVTLRHAEVLNEDGSLYTDNLRAAAQTNRNVFSGGGRETFEPKFTYHGFRYVEVTGLPERPAPTDLTGRVFCSSAPETGRFACSDPLLNRLASNILWTQRANLMSSPTDCPQRDERLGWMGDIQVFSQTAVFNMNMGAFFTKWLQDVRDAQAADGRFPDFAPHPFGPDARFSGVPAWGDAGVVVPWRMYENYGDTRILEEHFDAARRWIDYIDRLNPDHVWRNGRNNDYNDWLNGDTLILDDYPKQGGAVPNEVFATAFFAHSTGLVAHMARIIGRETDAERYGALAEGIRTAFWSAFGGEDGRITGETQAGYALALHFNLVPDALSEAAEQRMAEAVDRYGGRLSTGIQSTSRLMLELTRNGRDDLAYRLALARERPSWGYAIELGATTIWERWDGYVAGRGFQAPGMNSFNHWALGSVGEWLYQAVGGIRPHPLGEAPGAPGFQRFVIAPAPGGGLDHAEATYESIRGLIRSAWRWEGDDFHLETAIPPNTAATVLLPARPGSEIRESGSLWATAESNPARLEVPSGRYHFVASRAR
jgi:alpha-L-rhamnosidase